MRITKLSLENFRGFYKENERDETEPVEITFPDSNLCVLIGENGSGKTSVTDAIAVCLTNFLTQGYQNHEPLIESGDSDIIHQENGYILSPDDIHNLEKVNFASVELLLSDNGEDFSVFSKIKFKNHKDKTGFLIETNSFEFIRQIKYWKQELEDGQYSLPILTYYNIAKLVIDDSRFSNTVEQRKLQHTQLYAYENSFTKNLFDHTAFSLWFKDREDLENEFRIREQEDKREKTLEVVRLVINTFLSYLSVAELKDMRVEREPKFLGRSIFSLCISKSSYSLKLSQLSSGEKAILMLVADIARRIAIANPGWLEEDVPNYDYILQNATGIVLIDEIDLHLHPKWQRLVVPALTNTFPNVQFIVTTHSDEILRTVPAECIRKGEYFQEIPKYSKGHSSHYIKSELQEIDIRSPEVIEYLELIEEGKLETKRAYELKQIIERLDPNSDERMRINFAIRRKEALKK